MYLLLRAAAGGYIPMQYGSPILAYRFARRAGLPVWKFWRGVGGEAALAFALLLAMLPAFQ